MTTKMIQKFEVGDFRETHKIPIGSDILSVGVNMPKGNIAIYLAVNPEEKEEENRTFWVVSHGRSIPHDSLLIGSVVQDGMNLHLFELFNRHNRKILH